MHKNISCACTGSVHMHNAYSCACTIFLRMHENHVHAQECCAGTRMLCTHKNIVHTQETSACTAEYSCPLLCMRKNRGYAQEMRLLHVHADESRACTRVLGTVHAKFLWACGMFLCMHKIANRNMQTGKT